MVEPNTNAALRNCLEQNINRLRDLKIEVSLVSPGYGMVEKVQILIDGKIAGLEYALQTMNDMRL